MRPIRTKRLLIRNWEEEDRGLFHRINSDEQVMEFFPFRRDRAQSDQLFDRLRQDIDDRGFGFTALEVNQTGECIGFAGLHPADVSSLPLGTIEIGWRTTPEHWGNGYVTEAANAWLHYGFEALGLTEIVSFAVWNNKRSIAVMERIGMTADPSRDFDHPAVPDSHPHLKRHVLYCISDGQWRQRRASAGTGANPGSTPSAA